MPKVSVIIPAYNAARFINQTLEALLHQTFRDFEVLVIDDGSQDRTAALVQSYGPPVSYIRQPHGGVSSARNTGLSRAIGQYLAFQDADDLWEPRKLERQVAVLDSHPDVGLCFTSALVVDFELRPLRVLRARGYADFCKALLLYPAVVSGSCSSGMVRREFVKIVGGFDPELSLAADWDYWLRLSLLTKFAPIPEVLAKYRMWDGSMSHNIANLDLWEQELFRVLRKFYAASPPKKYMHLKMRCFSTQLLFLAAAYYRAKRKPESLQCLVSAIASYPPNTVSALRFITRRLMAKLITASGLRTKAGG
jgi:glycosyltransferase involved in cell wall biosynthesis